MPDHAEPVGGAPDEPGSVIANHNQMPAQFVRFSDGNAGQYHEHDRPGRQGGGTDSSAVPPTTSKTPTARFFQQRPC